MTENKPDFHQPQHPLPEEIQKMKRDETVCKYCGVSYLIHREIQVLQDKLKAVTKELEKYKVVEVREKQLQDEINQKNQRISEVEELLKQKDIMISELQNKIQDLDRSVTEETKARKEVENRLAEGTASLNQMRLKNEFLVIKLPSIKEALVTYKSDVASLKTEIKSHQETMRGLHQSQLSEISEVIRRIGNDRRSANLEISQLKSKIETSNMCETDLQNQLTSTRQEVERLKAAEGQAVSELKIDVAESRNRELDLKNQLSVISSMVQQLQTSVKDYEKRIGEECDKNKSLSFELEQFKTKLGHKEHELDVLSSQLRNKDILNEQTLKKLEKVIAQRENSLQEKTKAWDELRRKLQEKESQEKLAQQQASANSAQANDLKSEVDRVRKDCEALKAEREMITIAHQNQIQDLRNSFRQKMEEMSGWPDKLDRALRQAGDKHQQEMRSLESKFKENFTMELEIEKQKFEAMYRKNMSNLKDEESKLRAELGAVQARQRSEISNIHKQMADVKTRSRDNENALRQEVTGLKRIIADLEGRLGHLDSGDSALAISLQTKVKELERTIEEKNASYRKLQSTYETSREQIAFLEETVRKECEERFELTEALSVAKEELLFLKRPSGGYMSVNRSASSTPTKRNSEMLESLPDKSNKELSFFQKSNSLKSVQSLSPGGPYPPSKPKELFPDKETVASNSLQMGFDGDPVKTPTTGVKGGNLSSRRR